MGRSKRGDIWRIRNNEELIRSINLEYIVKFIKAQRISWLGHVKKMEVGAMPRKMMEGRLFIGIRKGRSFFEMDGRCGSRPESDEDKAVDGEDEREKWRLIVEEAKAY